MTTRNTDGKFTRDWLGDAMAKRLGRVAGSLLPAGKAPATEPATPDVDAPAAAAEELTPPGVGESFGGGAPISAPEGESFGDQVRRQVFGG